MRNGNYEQRTVEQVVAQFPNSSSTLREYGIDSTSRMSLRIAAEAASVAPDDLLAVLEYRTRRAARRAAQATQPVQWPQVFDLFEEHEAELEMVA